jgi:hypothetical protein
MCTRRCLKPHARMQAFRGGLLQAGGTGLHAGALWPAAHAARRQMRRGGARAQARGRRGPRLHDVVRVALENLVARPALAARAGAPSDRIAEWAHPRSPLSSQDRQTAQTPNNCVQAQKRTASHAEGGSAGLPGITGHPVRPRRDARALSQSQSLMSMSSEDVSRYGSDGCTAMLLRPPQSPPSPHRGPEQSRTQSCTLHNAYAEARRLSSRILRDKRPRLPASQQHCCLLHL